ncbi:hypothetical protein JJL45_05935 [Tamlana sp. s12]|uniref:hypothetical protein n=1 Tax=Tamlana sp. s12 TaxID=1630406 RepID=UPI0007FDBF74|nr:hypothetical protein [Tamlana sp. s12]OBQ55960.1 hypothetical protein VQ01_06125 [Tamlana sp. s12]QQY83534.1 hypothetical protein JJL45_05935 [Tamlana sp. s12]
MTPKQVERIQNKIKKIKKELAADKKHWGGYYHDGRGLRYLPPALYLKINDYTGALRYFNWFNKNFPEDSCYPIFLFEWTITLFKRKKIKDAEKKALETFCCNRFIIDVFLSNELIHLDHSENANWEYSIIIENLEYSKDQEELHDFTIWLKDLTNTKTFNDFTNKFIEIETALENEDSEAKRSILMDDQLQMLEHLKS